MTGDEEGRTAEPPEQTENSGFGFTWGETEGMLWLTDGDGEYKRIDQSTLAALRAAADAGPGAVETETAALVDQLREEGYLRAGGEITRLPTPEDVRLAPRVAAFLVAFGALCLVVALNLGAALTFPTDPRVNLWVLPYFTLAIVVHESGHYLVARPHMEPSIRLGLLNKIFPAVITTTNGAWRCPRGIRIWIALAGPFAEALFALVVAAVYLVSFPGRGVLATILLVQMGRILFVLNPLVDGDGYWIVTDALGIVNLRSRGFRDLRARRATGAATYAAATVLFTLLALVVSLYAFLRVFGPL